VRICCTAMTTVPVQTMGVGEKRRRNNDGVGCTGCRGTKKVLPPSQTAPSISLSAQRRCTGSTTFPDYDTVRCTLYRVGKEGTKNMRNLLTHICREFGMIYLGYSVCDNFSIQTIFTNAANKMHHPLAVVRPPPPLHNTPRNPAQHRLR